MRTTIWEPGNGARYRLLYGPLDDDEHLLVWLNKSAVGGVAFRVMSHFHVISLDYFVEKTQIRNMDDARALLRFLRSQGHKTDLLTD